MTARDFLAAVQQRADAADAVTGDGSDYVGFDVLDSLGDVPRLIAALTAALDLHVKAVSDDVCAECLADWPCNTWYEIDAALTPKEND